MRRIYLITEQILVILLILLIHSCKKKELPTLTTTSVSNITEISAQSGGNVTDDGNDQITSRGIVWRKVQKPTLETNNGFTEGGTGLGLFQSDLIGLEGNTDYYVRAFASNEAGTAYGNEQTFKTQLIEKPSVESLEATGITISSAYVGGNITMDGGNVIIERGLYWGNIQNPELYGTKVQLGSGTGSFAYQLTSLVLSTTYYVKAYARNAKGESLGNQISFKTLPILPTVITNSPTIIGTTFCVIGGNISNNGGGDIIEKGMFVGLSPNPEITDIKTIMGSGDGQFSGTVKGLILNTIFYAKAYAKNAAGISLGSTITFKTTSAVSDNEGTSYETVKSGNQWWTTENLKTKHFNNGDAIPTTNPATLDISSETNPKYQWSYSGDENNVIIYGRLYTWFVVNDSRGVCPTGWHIPSDEEWKQLEMYLGMSQTQADAVDWRGTDQGTQLKATNSSIPSWNGTNISGFTALPAGYREATNGEFYSLGSIASFWTNTLYGSNAYQRYLATNYVKSYRAFYYRTGGYSVRCIKDN
jgi:uncharacterized protein (TIGR02145 family)